MIELARAFAPVGGATLARAQPTHTLVFVSTDGGAFGALGAAHFAESSPYRENALAVISLDAIAGTGRPRLVIAGDTARSPSASLVRTAAVRVLEQTGAEPLRDTAVRQLLDLGFPFTLGEQGPFVARGIPAVTLTTLPDGASQATVFDDTFDCAEAGGARPGGAEPDRVARRRSRARAGHDQLRLPRHPHRPRLGDRARPDDGSAPVPDRHDRPLRALPAAADPAGAGRAQPPRPALLSGATRQRSSSSRRCSAPSRRAKRGRCRPTRACTSPRPPCSACSACCCSSAGSSPASG